MSKLYKELTNNVNKRGLFYFDGFKTIPKTEEELYVSLWRFGKDILKSGIKNYNGKIYFPNYFIVDVDGKSSNLSERIKEASLQATAFSFLLNEQEIPYTLYHSGRGFHFHIDSRIFKWKPSKFLNQALKNKLKELGWLEFIDNIFDKTRLIKAPGSFNKKSSTYKIKISSVHIVDNKKALSISEIPENNEPDKIIEIDSIIDLTPEIERLERNNGKEKVEGLSIKDDVLLSSEYPCIQRMLNGDFAKYPRHDVMLRLIEYFRKIMPEDLIVLMINQWANVKNKSKRIISKDEIQRAIDDIKIKGYIFNCQDNIKKGLCSNKCKLATKDIKTFIDSAHLEAMYQEFVDSGIEPINLMESFGTYCPVFPGDLIYIQAPPKNMKTTLIMNMLANLKLPTYFLELEMTEREIWEIFLQILTNKSEMELRQHYKQTDKKTFAKELSWLYTDFAPTHIDTVEAKIRSLPVLPNIVFIDHLRLLRANEKDPNKESEVKTQIIKDMAKQYGFVAITILEQTKASISNDAGTSMSAKITKAKGSIGSAYNASMILDSEAIFAPNTAKIKNVRISTAATRNGHSINLLLDVHGRKIIPHKEKE